MGSFDSGIDLRPDLIGLPWGGRETKESPGFLRGFLFADVSNHRVLTVPWTLAPPEPLVFDDVPVVERVRVDTPTLVPVRRSLVTWLRLSPVWTATPRLRLRSTTVELEGWET